MATKGKGLGRGLDALIPSYESEDLPVESGVKEINISYIKPNEDQPRKYFEPEKIKELSESIRQHGVIQPILVVKDGSYYTIVAGERRYRAAVLAGLKEVPVIEKNFTEEEILQIALIENLQREDLNDIEEAQAYQQLADRFSLTQEEIAVKIGKSRAAVANTLRLLALPEKIQNMVIEKKISAGHARAVISIEGEAEQLSFANEIISHDLSVREAEKLSKDWKERPTAKKEKKAISPAAPYIKQFEDELCLNLGTKVHILQSGKKGKIQIDYYSNDDLERLILLLKNGAES